MTRPNNKLPNFSSQDIARFWVKVKTGQPDDCWEWISWRNPRGYGLFTTMKRNQPHKKHDQDTWRANRVAYFLYYGEDPGPLDVMHICDHPPCCNPAHLRLGTRQENQADKIQKNRMPCGADASWSKLTPEIVKRLRRIQNKLLHYRRGSLRRFYRRCATLLNVSHVTIREAARGVTWRHLDG